MCGRHRQADLVHKEINENSFLGNYCAPSSAFYLLTLPISLFVLLQVRVVLDQSNLVWPGLPGLQLMIGCDKQPSKRSRATQAPSPLFL